MVFSNLALLLGPLQDPLLDGSLADEAVDCDLLGLAQPVSPVHGLLVHRGVPVAVVEDDLEERRQKSSYLNSEFQSDSLLTVKRLTVSAAVRLMPRPPALVLSRKTKMSVLQGGKEDGEGTRKQRTITIIYRCALKASRCSFRVEQRKKKKLLLHQEKRDASDL